MARKPDTVSNRIPEWLLQCAVAADLERRTVQLEQPFAYAASLEGVIGNLNPHQSKKSVATGVKKGEPDLRLYFEGGRLVFIELKASKGRLKDSQKERFPILIALGFVIHIVEAASEDEAVAKVGAIVDAELAKTFARPGVS